MDGDGLGGLMLWIFSAIIGMVALTAGGFVWVSRHLSRGQPNGVRAAITLGALLLGLGAGAAWATATFFESTWSPPPKVMLNLPPGFAHRAVILLEQPSAPRQLQWSGANAPFTGKSVALDVPPSGVIRVRSLGDLAGGDFTAEVTQGMQVTGSGSGPADTALDASNYLFVRLEKSGSDGAPVPSDSPGSPRGELDEVTLSNPGGFTAYVKAREKTAQLTQ